MNKAVVLYCDILGFSEKVSLNENAENHQIFDDIKTSIDNGLRIVKSFSNLPNDEIKNKFHYKLFSDNLYVSFSYSDNDDLDFAKSFWLLLFVTRAYQEAMLLKGILIRGGISFGNDFCDENLIFSPALIKAYKIESEQAVFPRIVIDSEIVEKIKKGIPLLDFMEESLQEAILYDWADLYFTNPVNTTAYHNLTKPQGNDIKKRIVVDLNVQQRNLNFIYSELNKTDKKNRKVFEKIKWFNDLLIWIYSKGKLEFDGINNFQNFAYLNLK